MNKSIISKQKWTVYRSSLIFGASVVLLVSFVFVRSRKRRKKSVLDCVATETQVIVIRDSEYLEQYIVELRKDLAGDIFCGHQVLGLDCEWKPEHPRSKEEPTPDRHAVSVIQLSGPTMTLVVQTPRSLPGKDLILSSALGELLFDDKVLKVGHSVAHDVKRLESNYELKTRGFLDLNLLWNWIWYEKIRFPGKKNTWRSHPGLAKMTRDYLNMSWPSSDSQQCSDWSVDMLSEDQIMYAAADAFASRKVFLAFSKSDVIPRHSRHVFTQWLQENKGQEVGDQLKPYTKEQLAIQKARKKERRKKRRKKRKNKLPLAS